MSINESGKLSAKTHRLRARARRFRTGVQTDRDRGWLVDELSLEGRRLNPRQMAANASRDHYAQLYDFAPVGYMVLNRDGVISDINATGVHLLSRTRQKLVGASFVSLISEADWPKYQNHLRLCSQRRMAVTTDLRLRGKKGAPPMWVELIGVATRHESGQLFQFKCAFMNATARKEAEEASRESEKRFQNLADAAPALIWVSGRNKACTYVNRRWLDFTGRAIDEALGDGWLQNVHPRDLKRRTKVYRDAFAARREFRTEYRLRRHDGKYRWMLDQGVPRFTAADEFRGYVGLCVDITERKQMESALEMAGRLPRENPAPVMRLSRGRVLSFANPAAQKVMAHWGVIPGYEVPRKIAGAGVAALSRDTKQTLEVSVGPQAFEITFAPVKSAGYVNLYFSDITDRKRAEEILRQSHEDLEERVRQRTRELTMANAILQAEISARKQAEQALCESGERFRLMIEGTRDYAIYLLDPEGRIATWNTGAEQINGYRANEIVGRHFSVFYPQEDARGRKPQQILEAARKTGRAEDEGWRIRKSGLRFWASVIVTALYGEDGKLRGFLKVTRDITERRRAQELLRLRERSLADFFERSPLGLLWVDPKGRIQRVNRAWLDLTACSSHNCLNHSIREFCADPKSARSILHLLEQRKILYNYRLRLRRTDGSHRHVLIDADAYWDAEGMLYSRWFIRDITRQINLEREILAVAERERQRIGRDLHDDLCQQLTGIEFLSQTLASRWRNGNQEEADRAREIAQMIRQAITYTRELAHGLSPTELETYGLAGALQELAARTRKLFGVSCRFRGRNVALNGDHDFGIHLYRIAQEAVSNAIKHGKPRRVNIGLTRNSRRLVLAVKDDGKGLPNKPRKRHGMGTHVMHYRAGVVGGNLVMRRNRTGGTTVTCTINHADSGRNTKTNL